MRMNFFDHSHNVSPHSSMFLSIILMSPIVLFALLFLFLKKKLQLLVFLSFSFVFLKLFCLQFSLFNIWHCSFASFTFANF